MNASVSKYQMRRRAQIHLRIASKYSKQASAITSPGFVFFSQGKKATAFTLVELLLVIAIIAIMASLVISAFSNASADSRSVLVRQQQAVVQEAVNSWLSYNSAGTSSLASAQAIYNGKTTGLERLELVKDYLDESTYEHLTNNTANANQVRSDAMIKTSQYLEITAWQTNSYPKVNLISQ